jgi:enoyl-CoA hydratase/carnithine racemase
LEIALCCDIRIAAEGTYNIGLPEVTLGVLPGTGGTQRLPRLIGRQRALELMIRGSAVQPSKAKELGIVDEVVPAASVQERAHEMASFFSTGPTLAIGQIKLATVIGGGMSFQDGMQYEHEAVARLFASEDAREGVTAFAEKRKPNYKGK